MSEIEDRVGSLEHSRTAFKAIAFVLGLLGLGLVGYSTYLKRELAAFQGDLPRIERDFLEFVDAEKRKVLAEINNQLDSVAGLARAKAIEVLADHSTEKHGVQVMDLNLIEAHQYDDGNHGKLLVHVEKTGRVTLSGLFGRVPNRDGVILAKLPEEYAPDEHQLFDVAVHPEGVARLDVLVDGKIKLMQLPTRSKQNWNDEIRGYSWVSLDGVSFFRGVAAED